MTPEQTPKSRARKIIKAWMANDNPSATIENDLFQATADEITAAILSERERCARVVEGFALHGQMRSEMSSTIAAAIRSEDKP